MPRMPGSGNLLDGIAAAKALGVKRESLYAYVSRGLIRTAPHPQDPRARLYSAADIKALQARKLRLRRPKAAAATALDWGLPVLQTGISTVADEQLLYRGKNVVALADSARFEDVTALLWGCDAALVSAAWFDPGALHGWQETSALWRHGLPLERAMALLPLTMAGEISPFGLGRARLLRNAALLLKALAAAIVGASLPRGAILHAALARCWRNPQAEDVIRRLLVLSADHELNPSTFAVRVTASTGAKLSAALVSGLAALSGPRHGGIGERLQALLTEAAAGDAKAVVAARLGRGEPLPGFGHPLYPNGDPRAALMLPVLKLDRAMVRLLAAARAVGGLEPNIDFALLAAERNHDLPKGAALSLFALGRSAGWLAHALEQIEMGTLIRPRAEFVGR